MGNNQNNIIGKRFGRLVVKAKTTQYSGKNIIYECLCDCGKTHYTTASSLTSGKVISCGCYKNELFDVTKLRGNAGFADGTCVSMLTSSNISKRNTSGTRGVAFDKSRNLWMAQIYFKGKRYYLGRYGNIIDAVKARKVAEDDIFDEFLEQHKKASE